MERQIKFRGKAKINGHWYYGDLCHLGEDVCIRNTKTGGMLIVDPETVGEYVCSICRDDLYDGDIVTLHHDDYDNDINVENFVVSYDNNTFRWVLKQIGESTQDYKRVKSNKVYQLYQYHSFVDFERIGTIYDNPELLTDY